MSLLVAISLLFSMLTATGCSTIINRPLIAERDNIISALYRLGGDAAAYCNSPVNRQGGGGSFAGWSMPDTLANQPFAWFTAEVQDTCVVLKATSKNERGAIQAIVLRNGRLVQWTYWGDFM